MGIGANDCSLGLGQVYEHLPPSPKPQTLEERRTPGAPPFIIPFGQDLVFGAGGVATRNLEAPPPRSQVAQLWVAFGV